MWFYKRGQTVVLLWFTRWWVDNSSGVWWSHGVITWHQMIFFRKRLIKMHCHLFWWHQNISKCMYSDGLKCSYLVCYGGRYVLFSNIPSYILYCSRWFTPFAGPCGDPMTGVVWAVPGMSPVLFVSLHGLCVLSYSVDLCNHFIKQMYYPSGCVILLSLFVCGLWKILSMS